MEALCWILFETNLAELILAQAYHSHRLTMAARLSEAGAPPPHEVTELSSVQSQTMALIRFARQHAYFITAPDGRTTAQGSAMGYHASHSSGGAPGVGPSAPLPPGAFGTL